ncbi:MAG TPA: universal stress protein [Thermomicrobiales bacterium]|nr:universal stress protein [Thermomicrobiales bacterium]
MFDHIIAVLSGSTLDDTALSIAADEALRHNAVLVLLRTIDPGRESTLERNLRGQTGRQGEAGSGLLEVTARSEAVAYLEAISRRHHLYSRVELVVRKDMVSSAIIDEATCRQRSLVVMPFGAEEGHIPGMRQGTLPLLLALLGCPLMFVGSNTNPPRQYAAEVFERNDAYAGIPF